jgi:hypothetical protein
MPNINDLPDMVHSICKLLADDTKLVSVVDREEQSLRLQRDVNCLSKWSDEWLMEFNKEKCVVVHYGSNNQKYDYFIGSPDNRHQLIESSQEKDLGVIFRNDLKSSAHVAAAVRKANQALGLIKRSFRHREIITIKKLYTALVRPHLEYAVQVWNPYLKSDITSIEGVQRRATKLVSELRNMSYEERLKKLNLTTLEERRQRGDLIEQFKIVKKFDVVDWHHPLTPLSDHYGTRSHNNGFEKQLVRNCNQRSNFFTNRVANDWNRLPREIIEQNNVNCFKNKIDIYFKKTKTT